MEERELGTTMKRHSHKIHYECITSRGKPNVITCRVLFCMLRRTLNNDRDWILANHTHKEHLGVLGSQDKAVYLDPHESFSTLHTHKHEHKRTPLPSHFVIEPTAKCKLGLSVSGVYHLEVCDVGFEIRDASCNADLQSLPVIQDDTDQINELQLRSAFLTSGHSKRFTILSNIHPFTHRRRSQPSKATSSLAGAVRVRCLAQGQLDTRLGAASDQTSNLPVTSQAALSPEPHAAPSYHLTRG